MPSKKNKTRTATRKAGALVSIAMSLILAFGAVSNAYGSVSFAWLNPANGTQFTNIVTAPAFNFPLYVGIDINGDGTTSPFPSQGDATSVDWSVAYDPNGIVNGLKSNPGFYNPSGSDYYAYAFVNSVYNTPGAASILATYTPTGQYLNITIAIDAGTLQAPASNITVYLVNTSDTLYSTEVPALSDQEFPNLTVYAPNQLGLSYTSMLLGESQAFQNLPTAMAVLDNLLDQEGLASVILSDGSYAFSIGNLDQETVVVSGVDYYWGWTYAVYDASGNLLDIGEDVIAASVMMLDDDYTVVWKYDYNVSFQSTLAAEISTWD